MKSVVDPMLSIVEPMQPTLRRQPFSHPYWIFEPKWDGFRAICFLDQGSIRFVSRNQNSLTEKFPELQANRKRGKGYFRGAGW